MGAIRLRTSVATGEELTLSALMLRDGAWCSRQLDDAVQVGRSEGAGRSSWRGRDRIGECRPDSRRTFWLPSLDGSPTLISLLNLPNCGRRL
jgi:hypothetical protein